MSGSKASIIEHLYMLMRLEHSRNRCEEEGTFSDEEVAAHFAEKRAKAGNLHSYIS